MRQLAPRDPPVRSHAALRARKPRPVEAEFLTSVPDNANIKRLMRAAKRNLRLSIVVMDRHHDLTLMTLLMFMPIEPAPLLFQPFSKCCAFHRILPFENPGVG